MRQAQEEISNDVKVKTISYSWGVPDGFDISAGMVGNVQQRESQLIGTGKLSEDEETEMDQQMNLLNSGGNASG